MSSCASLARTFGVMQRLYFDGLVSYDLGTLGGETVLQWR